ncbi:MAG: hypothetical protein AB8B83_05360 [Bdellovibrionales bacterium]
MSAQPNQLTLVSDTRTLGTPDNGEPESSTYPDPKASDTTNLMSQFVPHMDKILTKAPNARNYREFALTFGLTGHKTPFNMRMRCHANLLEGGEVVLTNWQLTFKTRGNHEARQEIETEDNLLSSDISAGLAALKLKYGKELPTEIANIDQSKISVDVVALNPRIGKNGLFDLEFITIPDLTATVMVNADNTVFMAPEICDAHGNLLFLSHDGSVVHEDDWANTSRPEAEVEILSLTGNFRNVANALNSKHADQVMRNWFKAALKPISQHASNLFTHTVSYTTSKVDEGQKRSRLYQGPKPHMLPSDFTTPTMLDRLSRVMQKLPSPYGNDIEHSRVATQRTNLIRTAATEGRLHIPYEGYAINLAPTELHIF